jgi:hypothetical protein
VDWLERINELLDVIFLSYLQPLAEPIDDDSNELLVGLLEFRTHFLNFVRKEAYFYRGTILTVHELFHHAIKQTKIVDTVARNQRIIVKVAQLPENKFVFLFVAQEEYCNEILFGEAQQFLHARFITYLLSEHEEVQFRIECAAGQLITGEVVVLLEAFDNSLGRITLVLNVEFVCKFASLEEEPKSRIFGDMLNVLVTGGGNHGMFGKAVGSVVVATDEGVDGRSDCTRQIIL